MNMFNSVQLARNKTRKCFGVLLRCFLLFCVLTTYGGGSSLLQGVAWLTMIPAKIVSTNSIEEGLIQTFNGENPCALCKIANNLREIENDNSLPDQPNKLKKPIQIMEKTVHRSSSIKVISPISSLILFEKESHHTLLRISLEVDIPPPDLV